jgi:hypothetical protein
MNYTLLNEKNNMGSYNYGIKSSYLKSKIGGVITDFKSKFLIAAISTVNCSLLQVFYEEELPSEISSSGRFYRIVLSEGSEFYPCYVDCSGIISRNLEDIVSWLSAYPASFIAHINMDELDEIVGMVKQSSSIPYKLRKSM